MGPYIKHTPVILFVGYREQVYIERGGVSGGGETIFRDPARLSNYVTTFDTRGLVDLSALKVPEVIAEISEYPTLFVLKARLHRPL